MKIEIVPVYLNSSHSCLNKPRIQLLEWIASELNGHHHPKDITTMKGQEILSYF